jgi:DNA-directed RNA polymerase specialized sigma24 family protein
VTETDVDPVSDRGTFDEVFAAERAPMVRVAFLIVGSQAVAEEIVQDAFAGLYARFDDIDNAAAYVRTAVVRGAVTWKKRRPMETDRVARITEPGPIGIGEIDTTWDALRALRPERRAVLVLGYYEDLSHAQIAELLGCPVATVRTRLHRGLNDLRKELAT